jgi:hypothetical protein
MNKTRSILAALVLLFTGMLAVGVTASPASATEPIGSMTHYSPDDGFDDAFLVECRYLNPDGSGRLANIFIGEGSNNQKQGCPDVQRVYVAAGNQIACFNGSGFVNTFDATGWHALNQNGFLCVHQKD